MRLRPVYVAFCVSVILTGFLSLAAAAQQPSVTASSSTPELDQLLASRESGLLTNWSLAGPFGKSSQLSGTFAPERDQLGKQRYGTEKVRSLQFASGRFELPADSRQNGVFYAASDVWLPNAGEWRLYAETAGEMMVFVDGKISLQRQNSDHDLQTTSQVMHLERGTHRIVVKFTAAAAPFHVAVMPQTGGLRKRNNKPNVHITPESEYVSAELRWPDLR